jgi:hypothetical protein
MLARSPDSVLNTTEDRLDVPVFESLDEAVSRQCAWIHGRCEIMMTWE